MKPAPKRNLVSNTGYPYGVVELGAILFFGGDQYYEVTGFNEFAHPMCGDINLFELDQKSKSVLVLEK